MIVEEKKDNVIKIAILFYICSLFGFIYETILSLIVEGKLLEPGLLYGPWLPIYGTGAILIYFLNRFRKHPFLIFILSFFITGLLEWVSGYLILKFLGKRLWDYTGWFLNINGHVCFLSALCFGIGGLIIIYLLLPLINKILKKINRSLLYTIIFILSLFFGIDVLFSIFK